jgi:mannose-6-phosphate isomerase-like protein (cupin superfamily)
MRTEIKEKMRGGEGNAEALHLVECANEKNIRLLAQMTLQPGASIGSHAHEAETEYYVILSGSGLANDNGAETEVTAGDAIVTGGGAAHGIANNGSVPLVFIAAIVTYEAEARAPFRRRPLTRKNKTLSAFKIFLKARAID